jgi:hypothetical protein
VKFVAILLYTAGVYAAGWWSCRYDARRHIRRNPRHKETP